MLGCVIREDTSLVLCTIEKANQLINRLIEQNSLDQIKTLVIDELHMIGDPSRGFLLELMLSKIQYINEHISVDNKIQIIAMSATFPNLKDIADWLNARLYITNFRPVEVKEYIKFGNDILSPDCTQVIRKITLNNQTSQVRFDRLGLFQLISETINDKGSVLVFCPSKDRCEEYCQMMMNHVQTLLEQLGQRLNFDQIKEYIPEQYREEVHPLFIKLMEKGAAYHHSGLTMEERECVELFFKQGIVKVIFCTSTLAAGVNLPAKRVIITSMKQGMSDLTNIQYKQMIGRAGRYGYDTEADSILVVQNANEKKKAMELLNRKLERIDSCLDQEGKGLSRIILEAVGTKIVQNSTMMKQFLKSTLLFNQYASQKMILWNELHILYQMTPVSGITFRVQWDLYHRIFRNLTPNELQICQQIGIKEDFIVMFGMPGGQRNQGFSRDVIFNSQNPIKEDIGLASSITDFKAFAEVNKELITKMRHVRFYTTLLLKDLLSDEKQEDVQQFYKITQGELQAFQQKCSAFSSMVVTFCHELKWWNMWNILNQYMDRINFVIQEELEELLQVKQFFEKCIQIKNVIDVPKARAIYEAGFTSTYHISKARPADIMKALQKTLVIQRQYSSNIEEMFKVGTTEHSSATITKAEEIIEAAKSIQRKKNLKKAREILKKKQEWLKQQKQAEQLNASKQQQQYEMI
ncbi:dna polymerase theta-like [Stylonychia lemnae]|uniref:Dna polymerase theta-like n=1 Tax=Stylonychia lemnae TaxID=5949 RepID=A0A078AHP5_STYLE|nr:dna polymerase theta-like [Stylonychia lemnae]|eukprot:CDW80348.1 dna polymerase theta-like [Stylonychia lemnae]